MKIIIGSDHAGFKAKQEIKKVEAETGLPATDPVRFGCKGLVRALEFLRN